MIDGAIIGSRLFFNSRSSISLLGILFDLVNAVRTASWPCARTWKAVLQELRCSLAEVRFAE